MINIQIFVPQNKFLMINIKNLALGIEQVFEWTNVLMFCLSFAADTTIILQVLFIQK